MKVCSVVMSPQRFHKRPWLAQQFLPAHNISKFREPPSSPDIVRCDIFLIKPQMSLKRKENSKYRVNPREYDGAAVRCLTKGVPGMFPSMKATNVA